MFFSCACAFPFQSFNFLKNLDFISQIWYYFAKLCVSALRKQAWNSHLIKNSGLHVFFPCACAFLFEYFLTAKIQFSQIFFLFVKTMRLCTAHKRIKMTDDKKIRTTSFFCAPMRFHVQRFISLKKFYFVWFLSEKKFKNIVKFN